MRYPTLRAPLQIIAWAGDLVRQLERDAGDRPVGGACTLAVSPATTTTVSDSACRKGRRVLLFPTTSNAADDAADVYVSAVAEGSFTVTHNADAATDRDYSYVVV